MQRRALLSGLAATGLVAPRLASAQGARVLRFVPQADLAVPDPHFSIAFVTRNHAYLVYDFLFAMDDAGRMRPQMAESFSTEEGGRLWTITLREGLRFHDGEPVLARDVVASLRRWATRNVVAIGVFADLESLDALSDRRVRLRFRRPFPLLPELLGRPLVFPAAIMPERLARTPGTEQVSEIVGSGPYRWIANERVPGQRAVYARFDGYRPRGEPPSGTAGGKVAHFERVEWITMPDGATAAAALQAGEIDWWEQPVADHLPRLRGRPGIAVETLDPQGFMAVMRFNHLQPPFDNPAIRRAFLGAFNQTDMMVAVVGTDASLRRDDIGFFHPSSPLATRAGLEALSPRPVAEIRAALAAAGYNGEPVRLLVPADLHAINMKSQVAGDVMRRAGVNLDYVSLDWGAVVTRLGNRGPLAQGGWSATCNFTSGLFAMDPLAHGFLRGQGQTAVFGWPTSPPIEDLRQQWMEAADEAERRRLGEALQRQALQDVPYVPLGGFSLPAAYRRSLVDMVRAPVPMFTGVARA